MILALLSSAATIVKLKVSLHSNSPIPSEEHHNVPLLPQRKTQAFFGPIRCNVLSTHIFFLKSTDQIIDNRLSFDYGDSLFGKHLLPLTGT